MQINFRIIKFYYNKKINQKTIYFDHTYDIGDEYTSEIMLLSSKIIQLN